MKLHVLQHVPFEGPGMIAEWAEARGHEVVGYPLFEGAALPAPAPEDWIVVMGGPMSIHDETEFGWLRGEKVFLRGAIDRGRTVLGICLGAQLIADVLGGTVARNPVKEIGWFPVHRAAGASGVWENALPDKLTALHWHGETFSIPPGAVRLMSSEACINQAFVYGPRVLAFQFHWETTGASLHALVENCADELVDGPFIQTAEEMLADPSRIKEANAAMLRVLDTLAAASNESAGR